MYPLLYYLWAINWFHPIYTYYIYTHSHKIIYKEALVEYLNDTPYLNRIWGFYNEILLRGWSREEDNKRDVKDIRTIFW